MEIDYVGVHTSHCCARHGCKYGDEENCPVKNLSLAQQYPCEYCADVDEMEAEIVYLRKEIDFVKSLQK